MQVVPDGGRGAHVREGLHAVHVEAAGAGAGADHDGLGEAAGAVGARAVVAGGGGHAG